MHGLGDSPFVSRDWGGKKTFPYRTLGPNLAVALNIALAHRAFGLIRSLLSIESDRESDRESDSGARAPLDSGARERGWPI